jgi:hypothetical protein
MIQYYRECVPLKDGLLRARIIRVDLDRARWRTIWRSKKKYLSADKALKDAARAAKGFEIERNELQTSNDWWTPGKPINYDHKRRRH